MPRSANQRLETWLSGTIPEGQRLDFKQELHVTTASERQELLKDLTAMGNGGGGTIAFGIAERKAGEESFADHVTPLTDRADLGRMTDLILSTVRPTLIWSDHTIETEGGFVHIVDVEPSSMGPYMVQLKQSNRYYRRIGDRSVPMDEAMVRDLYALAASWQRDRDELWKTLHLPIGPRWEIQPLLTVTGVPTDLREGLFDPARLTVADLEFDLPAIQAGHHAQLSGLSGLTNSLGIWADGFFAAADGIVPNRTELPPAGQVQMRIHRTGSIAFGAHIATADLYDPVRMTNAYLAYAGAIWSRYDVRSVELRVELTGFDATASTKRRYPEAPHPDAAPPIRSGIQEIVPVADLTNTSTRHRLLLDFANRIANSFGHPTVATGWTNGLLRTPNTATRLIAARGEIYAAVTPGTSWPVAVNGSVRDPGSLETRVAWWHEGALLDLDGNLLATTEFPICDNLPDDFAVSPLTTEWADELMGRDPEELSDKFAALAPIEPPACSGQWNDADPHRYMREKSASSPQRPTSR